MITLNTRDGSRVGNAIIYGGETRWCEHTHENVHVFLLETDFGNHMVLTWREIEELYTIGRYCDYQQWREERARLTDESRTRTMGCDFVIPRFDDGPTAAN